MNTDMNLSADMVAAATQSTDIGQELHDFIGSELRAVLDSKGDHRTNILMASGILQALVVRLKEANSGCYSLRKQLLDNEIRSIEPFAGACHTNADQFLNLLEARYGIVNPERQGRIDKRASSITCDYL